MARGFVSTLKLCLRSRCPVCAQGRLFTPYLQVRTLRDLGLPPESCGVCDFRFAREPGYYFGVLMPALSFLSLVSGIVFVTVASLVFGATLLQMLVVGAVGVFVGLFALFRTSMAIYIALDHAIDPPEQAAGNAPPLGEAPKA